LAIGNVAAIVVSGGGWIWRVHRRCPSALVAIEPSGCGRDGGWWYCAGTRTSRQPARPGGANPGGTG